MKARIVDTITLLAIIASISVTNINSHSQSATQKLKTNISETSNTHNNVKLKIQPLKLDTLMSKIDTVRSIQNNTKGLLETTATISKNNYNKARNIKSYLKDSVDLTKIDTVLIVKKVLVLEKTDTIYREHKTYVDSPVKKEERNFFDKIFKIFPSKRK